MTTTDQWAPLKLLGCGAVSGIVTKTAVAPLERVKILYQVQGKCHACPTHALGGFCAATRTVLGHACSAVRATCETETTYDVYSVCY